jgi:hypothetical protein
VFFPFCVDTPQLFLITLLFFVHILITLLVCKKQFVMASTSLFDDDLDSVPLQVDGKQTNTNIELPTAPKTGRSQLGADFLPSDLSVICGRGKESYNHTGNHCFRILTSTFVERYSQADSKTAKSAFVYNIVTMIREAGGHFCKYEKDEGAWFEVGDRCAREKVSSLFRDMLHTQYRSSAKAKTIRRSVQNRNKTRIQQHSHSFRSDQLSVCAL